MTINDQPNPETEPQDDSYTEYEADDTAYVESEFADDLYVRDDSLDIDAALAAVSSLSDLMAEREVQEAAEQREIIAEQQIQQERVQRQASYVFPRPAAIKLQPGSPASVIPALLLIAAGAYLTFALTLSDTPPAPGLVILMMSGVAGLTLLGHWLASGRWARGSLFAGLLLPGIGAALYLSASLPVWFVMTGVLGLAILLTGLLAKPASGRLVAFGLATLIGTGVLLAINGNLVLTDIIRTAALVVLPVILILMLLSLIVRRRSPLPS